MKIKTVADLNRFYDVVDDEKLRKITFPGWEWKYPYAQETLDKANNGLTTDFICLEDLIKYAESLPEDKEMSAEIDWGKPLECDAGKCTLKDLCEETDFVSVWLDHCTEKVVCFCVDRESGVPLREDISKNWAVRNKKTVAEKTAQCLEELFNDPRFSMKPDAVAKKMEEQGLLAKD